MILRFSERVAIDDEGGIAFSAYLGEDGTTREAVMRSGAEGLTEIAAEGVPAPAPAYDVFEVPPPAFEFATHTYRYTTASVPGNQITVTFEDTDYSDNRGQFSVQIYST